MAEQMARAKSRAEKVKRTLRATLNALPQGDEILITTAGQVDGRRPSGNGDTIRGARFHRNNVQIKLMHGARVERARFNESFENDEVYADKRCPVCSSALEESEMGGYCSACSGEVAEFALDADGFEGELLEQELRGTALTSAVEYNRKKAKIVGWYEHFDSIVSDVLQLNYTPNENSFAQEIANWQDRNGLDDDGKIGPGTWKTMKVVLRIKNRKPKSTGKIGPLPAIDTPLPDPVGIEYRLKKSSRDRGRQYGISQVISAVEWIAREWHKSHPEIVMGIADISKNGGGILSPHKSHRLGLDVDVGLTVRKTQNSGEKRIGWFKPIKKAGVPIVSMNDYKSKYRQIMKEFLALTTRNKILPIKVLYYWDHELSNKVPKGKSSAIHYKHVHIRFCRPPELKSALNGNKVGFNGSRYDCREQSELFGNDMSSDEYYSDEFNNIYSEQELSDSALTSAVQYNRIKSKSIGWYKHFDNIVASVLKLNYSPTEDVFAHKVAEWQGKVGLDDDGKIGEGTWNRMKSILGLGESKPNTKSTPKTSYKAMEWSKSGERSLLNDFVERYNSISFENSGDINAFFKQETGYEFCAWFREKVGFRGFFGRIPYNPKYTGPKGRSPKTIPNGQESNFKKVYDNIPLLYSGNSSNGKRINLLEFFALTIIIINEHSGNFTVGTEKGSLRYLYRYNPKDSSSPRSAFNLLHNKMFMAAHSHKGKVPPSPFSQKWKLRGRDNYPSSSPTTVDEGGLISEMDFCKFRGRGLIQNTFRGNYKKIISHIMDRSYRSSSPLINKFKEKYARKSSNKISVLSSNKEWDDLFLKTDYEIACVATYVFQKYRNDFLDIEFDKNQLVKESRFSSGAGSLFYVGYRQGGTRHYGRVVKKRTMQMMDALLNS